MTSRLRHHTIPPVFLIFVPSQINGQVLYGHSHQNASAMIKSSLSKVKIIFVRYRNVIILLMKLLMSKTSQ